MTYVLGISCFYHDSAAVLLKNGEILSAIQEERLSRIKHDPSFPSKAIKNILEEEKIELNDIEYIVFYEKPFLKFERILETYLAFVPKGFISFAASITVWIKEKLFQKSLLFRKLQDIDKNFNNIKKIKFCEHHLSHIASAYYPSPFENAVILTIDGVGEWTTTSVAIGDRKNIEIKEEIHFPHSLGLLYSAVTYYLGFRVNSGEYKVMGLAPYGKPIYKELILKNLVEVKNDGSFKLDMSYFDFATNLKMVNQKFENLFQVKVRNPEKDEITNFHMNVASSIQAVTEEIILKITRTIAKKYKLKNLCLAGGVALNCVANSKVLKDSKFENIWIQPASGDAGGALGAALAFWHIELGNHKKNNYDSMKGSYLGPKYTNYQIEKSLSNLGAKFEKLKESDLLKLIVKELKKQRIIGWFQGRMEFGPRALGRRSIIADPRSTEMQKNLNIKTKFRESFRPFAPSIMKEHLNKYFKLDIDSPYMLFVAETQKKIRIKAKQNKEFLGLNKINIKRSIIPSVTHVDYTARIQTVDENTNKKFYNLLNDFYQDTKCPLLINTSFNIRGEPIVCSPEDAFKCFMGNNLEILVIENYILYKEHQNLKLFEDYRYKFKLD